MRSLKLKLFFILLSTVAVNGYAQPNVENAIFWRVSGNELKEPSYLFGTLHLAGREYLDSIPAVAQAFRRCRSFGGEVIFDTTMIAKLSARMIMNDSTLSQVLKPEDYTLVAEIFKKVTGLDITNFANYNPTAIQLLITTAIQNQLYSSTSEPLDVYFQQQALTSKKMFGLETFDEQLDYLYGKASIRQQGANLMTVVTYTHALPPLITKLHDLYRQQDINTMLSMMENNIFYPTNDKDLLFERNLAWLQKLLTHFRSEGTFAAVGVLHLAGESGLVNLLRQHGYTVTPAPLR